MKTSAYKSWTAEIEVIIPNGVEAFFRPATWNPRLRVSATSQESLEEAEQALRDVVERLQKELA